MNAYNKKNHTEFYKQIIFSCFGYSLNSIKFNFFN